MSLPEVLKKLLNGGDESSSDVVRTDDTNNIYFTGDVTDESARDLTMKLRELAVDMVAMKMRMKLKEMPPIFLRINSCGGSVDSGFQIVDCIKSLDVPVISVIEGMAASCASLIAVVCSERRITKRSHTLIHQVRTPFMRGKLDDINDEVETMRKYHKKIRDIYVEHTNLRIMPVSRKRKRRVHAGDVTFDVEEMLEREVALDADQALELGLVDVIEG